MKNNSRIDSILNLVRCPFCQSKINIDKYTGTFGIVACICTEYPIVNNILYLNQSDSLLNKRLCILIRKENYNRSVWVSLSEYTKIQRSIVFVFYYLNKYVNIPLINEKLLPVLKLMSKNKSWYKYLIERYKKKEIFVCANIINKHKPKIIVDVGCGIGQLYNLIKYKTTYVGIDKEILTLHISQILNNQFPLLICTDIDFGLPFAKKSINCIVYLDCFYNIRHKKISINQSFTILKNSGLFLIMNTHAKILETQWFGYGINPNVLNKYLVEKFKNVIFFDMQGNQGMNVNNLSYSCTGIK